MITMFFKTYSRCWLGNMELKIIVSYNDKKQHCSLLDIIKRHYMEALPILFSSFRKNVRYLWYSFIIMTHVGAVFELNCPVKIRAFDRNFFLPGFISDNIFPIHMLEVTPPKRVDTQYPSVKIGIIVTVFSQINVSSLFIIMGIKGIYVITVTMTVRIIVMTAMATKFWNGCKIGNGQSIIFR